MSEFPFSPEELRRLEEISREMLPGMTDAAIETIAGMHARWYHAWQAAGVPEHRAAEWAAAMITELFRSSS